jgi:hypothetical protein
MKRPCLLQSKLRRIGKARPAPMLILVVEDEDDAHTRPTSSNAFVRVL